MALPATGNESGDLIETVIGLKFFDGFKAIGVGNDNDFVDDRGRLESLKRMGNDRSITEGGEEFVEAHSPTGAGGNDDRRIHEKKRDLLEAFHDFLRQRLVVHGAGGFFLECLHDLTHLGLGRGSLLLDHLVDHGGNI